MTIWLERFVLGGVCVAVFVYFVVLNVAKLHWHWRALLGGAVLLLSLLVGLTIEKNKQVESPSRQRQIPEEIIVAGVVVDATSNAAIPQAIVSLIGRSESTVTDDLGSFKLTLQRTANASSQDVRLHVAKEGFRDSELRIIAPKDGLVVPIHRN